MKIKTEREKFGERLKLALTGANLSQLKISDLATKFNLLHPLEPVTPQAVYKWVNGLSIPSNEKILTLAKLLNVSSEWLQYGIDENDRNANLSALDDAMISMFLGLTDEQKLLIIEIMRNFK